MAIHHYTFYAYVTLLYKLIHRAYKKIARESALVDPASFWDRRNTNCTQKDSAPRRGREFPGIVKKILCKGAIAYLFSVLVL